MISLHARNQLDSSSRFDTTSTCDERTDRQADSKYQMAHSVSRVTIANTAEKMLQNNKTGIKGEMCAFLKSLVMTVVRKQNDRYFHRRKCKNAKFSTKM